MRPKPVHKYTYSLSGGFFECRPKRLGVPKGACVILWDDVTCKVCLSRKNPKHTYKKNLPNE